MPSQLVESLRYPAHIAVDKAIHAKRPEEFHERLRHGVECPYCPKPEDEPMMWDITPIPSEDRAQPEQFVVVDKAPVSPALAAYLEENQLVPDVIEETGEIERIDYSSWTAKALRPVASAEGMKGARVASKADLVAYLEGLGA